MQSLERSCVHPTFNIRIVCWFLRLLQSASVYFSIALFARCIDQRCHIEQIFCALIALMHHEYIRSSFSSYPRDINIRSRQTNLDFFSCNLGQTAIEEIASSGETRTKTRSEFVDTTVPADVAKLRLNEAV